MNTLRTDIPEPPKHMRKLPISDRGFPVPWFVDWINGELEFRAMDRRKFIAAINDRRCWVCGNPLGSSFAFTIGPMCAVNKISSEPPSHPECARYSARACPFLSKPHMVRRTDGLIDTKHAAGVMIERNPGVTLLWFTRGYRTLNIRNRAGAGDGILFQIGRPLALEWYARGREATRAEVLESIESGLPALRATAAEHDGAAGVALLECQISAALRLVPKV